MITRAHMRRQLQATGGITNARQGYGLGSWVKEKIRKMRQAGLDREGEYSFENIAFKVLRRTEYLDKLSEIETRAYDKSLTLVESIKYLNN